MLEGNVDLFIAPIEFLVVQEVPHWLVEYFFVYTVLHLGTAIDTADWMRFQLFKTTEQRRQAIHHNMAMMDWMMGYWLKGRLTVEFRQRWR